MMRVTTFLAGAAALAVAVPAAAQYYPGYGSPYGGYSPYGGNQYGTDPYGYGYDPYGGNQYGSNPYGYGTNSQAVVGQCVNAVQARLNGGYGGGYGDNEGYGAGGYGGGRVLGISRVERGMGGGMSVRGVATTGRAGGYGHTPNSPVDLVWNCRTDYRGQIVDLDIDPAQRSYGNNYTPYDNDYSQYGYQRY